MNARFGQAPESKAPISPYLLQLRTSEAEEDAAAPAAADPDIPKTAAAHEADLRNRVLPVPFPMPSTSIEADSPQAPGGGAGPTPGTGTPSLRPPPEITAPPPSMPFTLPPGASLNAAAVSALAASVVIPPGRSLESMRDGEDDATVVVNRGPRIRWFLSVEGAGDLPLTTERVLLGRRPSTTAPGTQALAVPDDTRTVSKLHARLDLADGSWTITDLNSTNGVVLVEADGTELLIEPGTPVAVEGRFILGKVGMSIRSEGADS